MTELSGRGWPGRYPVDIRVDVASDWELERLTPPSRLYGANGMYIGPDGRIYVAQVSGSQISAIDPQTGEVQTISPMGGDIVAPDDLVFDPEGNLYATEITEGRVCMRTPRGETRVIRGDMPGSNPITWHQGRLFAGECRPGGRIMELFVDGREPRVLLDNAPMPNAMQVGPDGKLYIPMMAVNEIWRIDLDGGQPEVVARELGVPDAVKFDAEGFIVSTQVASGQVLRVNPNTGEKTELAYIGPGLDNLVFLGDRLFVSSISGQINEVLGGGEVRSLISDGLNWPLGLAVNPDGSLMVADGGFCYILRPGGVLERAGVFFAPGYPGYVRGVATTGEGEYIVTTANGQVARWSPAKQHSDVLADGYERLYGVAVASSGAVLFTDAAKGELYVLQSGQVEVLATGMNEPLGVALTGDGTVLVAEEGAGRIVKPAAGGGVETVLDGLQKPQGILVRGDVLFVLDAGARELVQYDLGSGQRTTIASQLPVGAPPGVEPKFLKAIPPLSGPMGPFADIAAGADGTLYISADGDGSVMALRPR